MSLESSTRASPIIVKRQQQPSMTPSQALVALLRSFLLTKRGLFWNLPILVLSIMGLRRLLLKIKQYLRLRMEKFSWSNHTDLGQIQACLLSSEHLGELGRVEKRTLLVKDLNQFFGNNSFVVNKLLAAASKTTNAEPVLTTFLENDDKWHILVSCMNQISSLFAPYHVFFNEARRCESYYRSAWYCFTLTCTRSPGHGRFFITPYKPVVSEDVGALRVRIIMVNEQELRDIATGVIAPPSWGFFNERHRFRWDLMKRFSQLFERQLQSVTGRNDAGWGANLCGRLVHRRGSNSAKNPSIQVQQAAAQGSKQEYENEDNCFLRIHIPFPASRNNGNCATSENGEEGLDMNTSFTSASNGGGLGNETRSKDVVLFE
jgi:hypothetical protein